MTSTFIKLPLAIFRSLRFSVHLAYGVTLAIAYPSLSASFQKRILRRWSAELLDIFNVNISTSGELSLQDAIPGLIVANHISWLDVFVLNAVLPLRFVAKSEVRSWPVLGWLCAQAQTIFIERNKRSDTLRTNQQAVESLRLGYCMAIFPEGTTTDGSYIRHFHSSLLQPAIDAQAPIYPVALRYHDKDEQPNLSAAYIDEMTFVESLWKILSSDDLNAHIATTPALSTTASNRRTLALDAHRQISAALSFEQMSASHAQVNIEVNSDDAQEHFQSPYSLLLYAPSSEEPQKA